MGATIDRLTSIEEDVAEVITGDLFDDIRLNIDESRKELADKMALVAYISTKDMRFTQFVCYKNMANFGTIDVLKETLSPTPGQAHLEQMLAGACMREPFSAPFCDKIILAGAYGCETCDDNRHPLIEHRVRYMLICEIRIGSDVDAQVLAFFGAVVALDASLA